MDWDTETMRYDAWTRRLELVFAAAIDTRPTRLLELGCSVGLLRAHLIAADIDHWGCDIATTAVHAIGDPQVIVHDLNDGLPFTGPFDCIIGSGILEYVHDLPALLDQTHDRLASGGTFVASYYNMGNPTLRMLRRTGKEPASHTAWAHRYPRRRLEAMLTNAGLEITAVASTVVEVPRLGTLPAWAPGRMLLAKEHVYTAVRNAGV